MSKDSAGRYVAVPVRTWNLFEAAALKMAPSAPGLYLRLATAPEGTRIPGVIRIGLAALAENLGWSTAQVKRLAAELEASALVQVDWANRLVVLPLLLREPCSRPNSTASAAVLGRELADLPRCALLDEVDRALRESLAAMSSAFLESYSSCKRAGESKGVPPLPAPLAAGLPGSAPGESPEGSLYSTLLYPTEPSPPALTLVSPPKPDPKPLPLPLEPKKKGRPKASRDQVLELVQLFERRWVEIMRPRDGQKPIVESADWGQASRLIGSVGLPAAKDLVERFLADRDPFLLRQGHTLRLLPSRANAYRARGPGAGQPASNNLRMLDLDEEAQKYSRPIPAGEEDR